MLSLRSNILCALCFGTAILLSPTVARAHFVLEAPASWSVENTTNGTPEKLGPCGNEGNPMAAKDAGQPVVTAFQEGQMITVTINEVITHPGHYRIALSLNWADAGDTVQAGFPADPTVSRAPTNSGKMVCPGAVQSVCGSVPIVAQTPSQTAEGWILADDVFEHCSAFAGPQTVQVALPPGVTCKECVLQVLEFMSDHGLNPQGGCFYHHCANISIQGSGNGADASTPSDATVSADAGSGSVSSGSVASSGTAVSSGTSVSGVASSGSFSSSGTSVSSGSAASGVTGGGSGANGSTPATNGAPASSGCSVSAPGLPGGGSGLAGIGLAMALLRRRRRS
jgi:MYXO-CTERM domain-containing protein